MVKVVRFNILIKNIKYIKMKLVKQEDGTVVQVQEISTPINIQSIDARIAGLKSTNENLKAKLNREVMS